MRDRKRERLTDMEKERLTGRLRKTDTEPENERDDILPVSMFQILRVASRLPETTVDS